MSVSYLSGKDMTLVVNVKGYLFETEYTKEEADRMTCRKRMENNCGNGGAGQTPGYLEV